jgi:hypothetical protein
VVLGQCLLFFKATLGILHEEKQNTLQQLDKGEHLFFTKTNTSLQLSIKTSLFTWNHEGQVAYFFGVLWC